MTILTGIPWVDFPIGFVSMLVIFSAVFMWR